MVDACLTIIKEVVGGDAIVIIDIRADSSEDLS